MTESLEASIRLRRSSRSLHATTQRDLISEQCVRGRILSQAHGRGVNSVGRGSTVSGDGALLARLACNRSRARLSSGRRRGLGGEGEGVGFPVRASVETWAAGLMIGQAA